MYIISLNSPNSPQSSFGYYFHFTDEIVEIQRVGGEWRI